MMPLLIQKLGKFKCKKFRKNALTKHECCRQANRNCIIQIDICMDDLYDTLHVVSKNSNNATVHNESDPVTGSTNSVYSGSVVDIIAFEHFILLFVTIQNSDGIIDF